MEDESADLERDRDAAEARRKLVAASSLHWFHWLAVAGSVVLTITAFLITKRQVDDRLQLRFEREADQVVQLISERMQRYEDALWGGVAVMRSTDGDIRRDQWVAFQRAMRLEERYPGINGIGVIYYVQEDDVADFVAAQRSWRPDFRIHPDVATDEHYPITFIEPIDVNEPAVGLDIAHEVNRLRAIENARDTRAATITGPIILVQDAENTPGFLFYAPFYEGDAPSDPEARQQRFRGAVYAPFVVKKLMDGVLSRDQRHVGIRIQDGNETLFDEHDPALERFDASPLFDRTYRVNLYGRSWTFDIRTDQTFRANASSAQPFTILIGGLLLDALLLALFVLLTQSNRRAIAHANAMTAALVERTEHLARSNADLEQFAYVASHDLQEPLRAISSFTKLLQEDLAETLNEESSQHMDFVIDGAQRMQILVNELLRYARVAQAEVPADRVDMNAALKAARDGLRVAIRESEAVVQADDLPAVVGDRTMLTQLLQNLVGNAVKFRKATPPTVRISAETQGDLVRFAVADDGIGLAEGLQERIFQIFQRLHSRRAYPGSGIGLALCRRIVERHGGTIWVESTLGEGSTFYFTLRRASLRDDA